MPGTNKPDSASIDRSLTGEIFGAVGFEVGDEDSYDVLAEYAEINGEQSAIYRGEATLHGRCWKLGSGLEVWSVLYESGSEMYYADCRPAFRSRYVRTIRPWELIEYDEDGEAIVRGSISGRTEIVFELQNLTAVSPRLFREGQLQVALAGLAYKAHVQSPATIGRAPVHRFEHAEDPSDRSAQTCENDYIICGQVLTWRELQNPVTGTPLAWIYVDASRIRLEIVVNRRALRGRLKIGGTVCANIWLQGHVLDEGEVSSRYEGVDPDYSPVDFWTALRRGN